MTALDDGEPTTLDEHAADIAAALDTGESHDMRHRLQQAAMMGLHRGAQLHLQSMKPHFGVASIDPSTGRHTAMMEDASWTIGDAAVTAKALHGIVVVAPRGEWEKVDQQAVARAIAHQENLVMDDELRRMADGA